MIGYISDGNGGCASEKYITEHSDFLDSLFPSDVILADRGFNIEDSVTLRGAALNIPAFTQGKV